jgi:hypothetical protein
VHDAQSCLGRAHRFVDYCRLTFRIRLGPAVARLSGGGRSPEWSCSQHYDRRGSARARDRRIRHRPSLSNATRPALWSVGGCECPAGAGSSAAQFASNPCPKLGRTECGGCDIVRACLPRAPLLVLSPGPEHGPGQDGQAKRQGCTVEQLAPGRAIPVPHRQAILHSDPG